MATTAKQKVTTEVKPKTVSKNFSVPVISLDGKAGTVTLPKEAFGVEVNYPLLSQYTRVYLANQRQGNASTKTRSEITGSTRKIFKQKGTGKARHGDIKAPIFVGGGVVGGPKPRDYSLKMSKKQKKQALFSALSLKFKEHMIKGLSDSFMTMKPKTKDFAAVLKTNSLTGTKLLVIVPDKAKKGINLAARNVPNIVVEEVKNVNPYGIMNSGSILIVEGAVTIFNTHFLKAK